MAPYVAADIRNTLPSSWYREKPLYELERRAVFGKSQGDIDFYKQVEGEDKILANNTQANLNTNTYVTGPLHPKVEEAVAYFETLLRRVLKDHVALEKERGEEVWPARRGVGKQQEDDDEFFAAKFVRMLGTQQVNWLGRKQNFKCDYLRREFFCSFYPCFNQLIRLFQSYLKGPHLYPWHASLLHTLY